MNLNESLDEKQQSVVDALVQTVTERILDGSYEPGRRLIEIDLSRDLNAGRGSVREALRRLQAGRLIVVEHNRGAVVADPSADEIRAELEVREVIFGLAARGAARSFHSHREMALALLATLEKEMASGKLRDHPARNREFHDKVHAMSGNPNVAPLMEQYRVPTLYNRYFRNMSEAVFRENVLEHWLICRAIIRADADGAEHLARMHERSKVPLALEIADASRAPKRRLPDKDAI